METAQWKELLHNFTKMQRENLTPTRCKLSIKLLGQECLLFGHRGPIEKLSVDNISSLSFFLFCFCKWNTYYYGTSAVVCFCECVFILLPSPPPFLSWFTSYSFQSPFSLWLTPQVWTSARRCSQAMAAQSDLWLIPHSSPWQIMNGDQPFVNTETCVKSSHPWNISTTKHTRKLLQLVNKD